MPWPPLLKFLDFLDLSLRQPLAVTAVPLFLSSYSLRAL